MEISTELHSNNPLVVIALAGLSTVGTVVSLLAHALIKKYVNFTEENEKLKEAAINGKIESARKDLMHEMTILQAAFKTLEAKVGEAIKETEAESLRQAQRLASAMTAIRNINAASEKRFSMFQEDLKRVHVYVERIKKGAS